MRNDATRTGASVERRAQPARRTRRATTAAVLEALSTPICIIDVSSCHALIERVSSGDGATDRRPLSGASLVGANAAALSLLHARSEDELARSLDRVFTRDSIDLFARTLRHSHLEHELTLGLLDGSERRVNARFDAITVAGASSQIAMTILPGVPHVNLWRLIPDLAFELDANGMYVDFAGSNDDALVEPNAFLGKCVTETLPPDVAHRTLTALARLRDHGGIERFEYALSMSDGFHWYEARLRALPSGGASAFVRDITEQKTAEWRLLESEQRFRTMADSAPMMMWMCDCSGANTFFNKTWLEFTGRAFEEEQGRKWMASVHPDDAHRYACLLEEHCASHLAFRIEYRLRRHDGEYRWLLEHTAPRFAADGQFLGLTGSCVDITDMKATQSELDEKVRTRTQELVLANRELEAFSYSVAHDLRGPLRAIDGFTQTILERRAEGLDAENVHYFEAVCAAAHRMDRLITDLLRLAQVSRAEVVSETVDVSALASEIAARLQHSAPQRRATISVQSNIYVRGDAGLVRIVLENLLGNAWKFTALTREAAIEVGELDQDDTSVCYVRDNGAGFDMQYVDRLFNAFERLHRPNEFEGTGIGLAMAHRIVQRHRGRMWADGCVGKGATFYFALPR